MIHLLREVDHGESLFAGPSGSHFGSCECGPFASRGSEALWRKSELRDQACATSGEDRIGGAGSARTPTGSRQACALYGDVDPLG